MFAVLFTAGDPGKKKQSHSCALAPSSDAEGELISLHNHLGVIGRLHTFWQ